MPALSIRGINGARRFRFLRSITCAGLYPVGCMCESVIAVWKPLSSGCTGTGAPPAEPPGEPDPSDMVKPEPLLPDAALCERSVGLGVPISSRLSSLDPEPAGPPLEAANGAASGRDSCRGNRLSLIRWSSRSIAVRCSSLRGTSGPDFSPGSGSSVSLVTNESGTDRGIRFPLVNRCKKPSHCLGESRRFSNLTQTSSENRKFHETVLHSHESTENSYQITKLT